MNNKEEIRKCLVDIGDVFNGADGGIKYIKVREFLENLSINADNGDKSSLEILNMVYNFKRLLDVADKYN